ncbi:MAG TPA: amidohydrolase family protein [Terriglobales bacterium]|jgi:imidazolonepropionase-like amidohydrolase|nr:amidohydrolase family protein [Terriglobales bacterium]
MRHRVIGLSGDRVILAVTLCCLLLSTFLAFGQKPKTAAAPAEQAIVLRGGKLLTITHGVIEDGVLVMENGKITAVGKAGAVAIPKGARVIEVPGMTVYPGLIDSETNLGLTEIQAVQMSNDLIEMSDEIMPHMHVSDAFHAESSLIPITRVNGVTNAIVAPDSQDTLPGQDSFIQLAGRDRDQMLLVKDVAMPMNFTGAQRRNRSFENAKFPFTRMGMAEQLRQAFIDAQEYGRKLADYQKKQANGQTEKKGDEPSPPKRDLKLEALLPYLAGEKPVVLSAEESNDLQTAVDLAHEFNLKIVLNHVTHTQSVLDYIAALKVPVIVGPIYDFPHDDQRYDTVYKLPAELAKRGVKIAFASYDSHNARNLPYAAGYAVAYGLPYDEALKAITLNPAEIWGVADRLGSLDAGKSANVVVANGDPLDVRTDVKMVFIQGREVPQRTRQTDLRDQYMGK